MAKWEFVEQFFLCTSDRGNNKSIMWQVHVSGCSASVLAMQATGPGWEAPEEDKHNSWLESRQYFPSILSDTLYRPPNWQAIVLRI